MSGPASQPLHILLVDDEPGICELVTHWLTKEGHKVISVCDGESAARMVKTQAFDIVITDIVMPESDGFEVIAMVRKLQPSARIVGISGGGKYLLGEDCLRMAKGLGAHAVVMKPFRWEHLRAGLVAALPSYGTVAGMGKPSTPPLQPNGNGR